MTASTLDTRAVPTTITRGAARRVPVAAGLAPLVLALLLWQLLGTDESVSFPRPSAWFAALGQMLRSGELLPALGATLATFFVGSLVALVVGVVAGVAIGSSRLLDRALGPILDFFRTLPPPVVVSVAGLILGITFQAGVTIVAFSVVWPILLNTVGAVRSVPPVRLEMARSMNLPAGDRFIKVLLPSLVPGIAVGFKIALSNALIITLLVDLLGSATGIGRLLLLKQVTFDAAAVWGLLLVIGAIGYVLNLVVEAAERRLIRSRAPSA